VEKEYASVAELPAALPVERRVSARRGWEGETSRHFEHLCRGALSCPGRTGHRSSHVPKGFPWSVFLSRRRDFRFSRCYDPLVPPYG